MYYAVDRFEGELAVLEDGDGCLLNVPRGALPAGTRQGDVVARADGGYVAAPEETRRRRDYARRLEEMLREK